jgi:hypothetical protein
MSTRSLRGWRCWATRGELAFVVAAAAQATQADEPTEQEQATNDQECAVCLRDHWDF